MAKKKAARAKKPAKKTPAKKGPSSEVLLFHAMVLMAAVDGEFGAEEELLIRERVAHHPLFAKVDPEDLVEGSAKLRKQYGGLLESVVALRDLPTEDLREKCLALTLDVAYASHGVDGIEREMFGTLERLLDVSPAAARKIRAAVAKKYAP
jgi:hypothetical protein